MSGEIEGSFTFVVPNISTLSIANHPSETHFIGNIPWKISVNQETVDNVKQLAVYIWCNWENDSQLWKVNGRQILSVLSHKDGVENAEESSSVSFNSEDENWGWKSFMDWDDLMDPNKGYVKDDSIQVLATIIIEKAIGTQSFGYNFQKSSDFLDVVLVADGQELHVNRAYLSNVSIVLKTLLSSNAGCNNRTRFEIKDVKYSEFLVFLAAVHHTPHTINKNNITFLLKLAKRFEVVPVLYQCEQFLMSFDDISLTKKFLLADKYCLAQLHNSCTKLLKVADVEALRNDEGYKDLTVESRDALLGITLKVIKANEKK